MQKPWSILGWITLGAFATAISTGYFLFQSNTDRAQLIQASEQAKQESEKLAAASRKLAEDANLKLNTASEEIRSAQELIQEYNKERDLLATAKPLIRTKTSSTWKEWVNIPLGFSMRLPLSTINNGSESYFDFDWLRIQTYDPGREAMWRAQATSTEEITYFINGKLLLGTRGTEWILHDQTGASSTILIWAKPKNIQDERILIEALSTLTFRR